ncbi:MAG: Fic family protein, partial [Candidatus Adiutrix sp.]
KFVTLRLWGAVIVKQLMWRPIVDLPEEWVSWQDKELNQLAEQWQERKKHIDKNQLTLYVERLEREWAIETGQIEGLYALDRGLTQTFIEHGLDAIEIPHYASDFPLRTQKLILSQKEVVEGLFSFVKQEQPLTKHYIRSLHAELTKAQEHTEAINSFGQYVQTHLRKGAWKLHPNNPIRPDGLTHEYCPPEHVEAEMDNLIKWYGEHNKRGIPPEIKAAWLHHRFTQIHPFQDGNGRVARALGTLVYIQAAWLPLVVTSAQRKDYIFSLEQADQGSLQPLVRFFANNAKDRIGGALKLSDSPKLKMRTKKPRL